MMMIAFAAALTAAAPDSSVATTTTPIDDDKPAWAAGFGFNFGFESFTAPFRVFAEHRFGDRFWLGAGAEAGFELAHTQTVAGPALQSTTLGLAASAGLETRVMANPGDPLEIGALGEVSLGVVGQDVQDHSTTAEATLGAVVQHWFTPQLAVRVSTSLVDVAASTQTAGATSSTAVTGGILFSPSIAALVAF